MRRRRPARSGEAGQAAVEAAVAFPLLILLALGLVQFTVFYHARSVVAGAVQDGARVAASADRTLDDGLLRARALLDAGIGRMAADVSVTGVDGADAVAVEANGRLRLIVPWVADATVPLRARAVAGKERFRVGPGS